jgi:dihydrolipoamide dehydrogenase
LTDQVEIRVPDIGDFEDLPVIEVFVSPGDTVAVEDPLVTIESDKATMDIPAPQAGVVRELRVAVGDKVSYGSVLLVLVPADGAPAGGGEEKEDELPSEPAEESAEEAAPASAEPRPQADASAQVVVIGGGPGGYTAAFRAADLGLEVVLVEKEETLGGVCLNVGCIPSKALLHIARVIAETREAAEAGVTFGEPQVDIDALRAWKEGVVSRLTGGLAALAKQRKVKVVRATARFEGPRLLSLSDPDGGTSTLAFDNAIIAAGSSAVRLPGLPDDDRIIDSTGALELDGVPDRLLVIGGGIIGLEMATVYDALGSRVTVVELLDSLIPGCDPDLVRPLKKRIDARYEAIHLGVKVSGIEAAGDGLQVSFEGDGAPEPQTYDRVLVAVGRRANGGELNCEAAGVEVDERGVIAVDRQMRTNVPHIHAIGDLVRGPMLAHKATHEGKVAAEVIAGKASSFDARTIPSVAYTDPEVAWMGLTETEAKEQGVEFEKAVFPWAASGRALSLGREDGTTKLLVDPGTKRVLGAGIVGTNAGELIAEAVHALEMGSDAEDIALTIHPHPTLSETLAFAAEMADGTITDLMPPKRKETK